MKRGGTLQRHTVDSFRSAKAGHIDALFYLNQEGLRYCYMASLRGVTAVELTLAGYSRKARHGGALAPAVLQASSIRKLTETNAGCQEVMLLVETYLAYDRGIADQSSVCPVSLAQAWRDFVSSWPEHKMTLPQAAKVVHCLVQRLLAVDKCPQCGCAVFKVMADTSDPYLEDIAGLSRPCATCSVKQRLTRPNTHKGMSGKPGLFGPTLVSLERSTA